VTEQRTRYRAVQPSNAVLTERRALTRLYRWALIVRVLVGLLAYTLTLYADLPVVEDALFYEEVGYEVAQNWLSGSGVDFDTLPQGAQTAPLLIKVIAAFYYLTNGVRVLPVLIAAFSAVTALVPIYVYRIARELQASEAVARRAAWLVALSPAFVFWSGSLYKEGFTLLLLGVAALHTLRLQARWQARSVIIVGLCIFALWGLRYYLAILLALAAALSLLWWRAPFARRSRVVPVFVRQATVLLVFVALIIGLGITERTERVLFESEKGLLVDLDVRRAGSAREAASGYLQEASIATPDEASQYLPLGLFYFLTVPFPWQVGTFRQNLIIPENVFWLMLYPLIVVGIVRALKFNASGTLFLLLMTAGMCVIYGLLAANVGTAYRMRSQVWLLWAPFAAWGWEVWRERRHGTREIPSRVSRTTRGVRSGAA